MTTMKVGPLENPIVWLGIQLAEVILIVALLRALVPDSWPRWIQFAVGIATLVLVTAANYWFRRRFIPQPPGRPARGVGRSNRRG
jgi:bacteriorhodopsin